MTKDEIADIVTAIAAPTLGEFIKELRAADAAQRREIEELRQRLESLETMLLKETA